MATSVEKSSATGPASAAEEIKPYRVHVSSRYLDLTSQKLEVTRLPHELDEPKSHDWWQPKAHVEPLIDFWMEQYSWREEEERLNAELPQFRTAFALPSSGNFTRVHFIHVRSPHESAIPLLLIPPFPFSSLSFGHLVKPLTEPEDVSNTQPFHLVIPSLPGIGFSDALPNNTAVIHTTAGLLDSLMERLSYPHYLATNASSGVASPAEIDYKLAEYLSTQYSESCLGTHLVSPPLSQPKLKAAPVDWAKWRIASGLHAPVLGYQKADFSALKRSGFVRSSKKGANPAQFGMNRLGLTEPNTMAYALCDSPTGLLVYIMKSLHLLGHQRNLYEFSPTEIINFTQLAWLPGPESAMRFWANCAQHPEQVEKKTAQKPRIALTVFLGDETEAAHGDKDDVESRIAQQEQIKNAYSCPNWAKARYNVVHAHRAPGKPGLLAWERPEIIFSGVRGLASAVLKADPRIRPVHDPTTAPLTGVVVTGDEAGKTAAAPEADVPSPALLAPPKIGERGLPHREISDDTAVASDENLSGKTPSRGPKSPGSMQPTPTNDTKAQ